MPDKKSVAFEVQGFLLGVLAVGVVFGAMVLFVMMFTNTPRTTQATQYDLDCVAEPIDDPLNECRK